MRNELSRPAAENKNPERRFNLWERIKIVTISTLACALLWLINRTVRYDPSAHSSLENVKRDGGAILSFWHNELFMAIYVLRFEGIMAMTSRALDGEYAARVIRSFGNLPARGSSSRGGVAALLEMRRHLQSGQLVAFAADGPRGPRYEVKPGALWLSAKVGRPILCLTIQPASYWELKSWDGFRIPKPFTRAIVRFGRPLQVPGGVDPESGLADYQAEMERLGRAPSEAAPRTDEE